MTESPFGTGLAGGRSDAHHRRLLALDLDDTLLEEDLAIKPEAVRAVKGAIDRGIHVLIATGRMYRSALPYAKQLGLDTYLITYNGGLIRHTSGHTLYHNPVPREQAWELIDVAHREDLRLNFYIDDRLYVAEVDDHVRYYQHIAGVDVFPVGDLSRILHWGEPTKCLFVGDAEQIDRVLPSLQRRYDHLQITRSKERFIEVTRLGVDKGAALLRVAGFYGVATDDVVAIGDNDNDVSMITTAGTGIAVANASPGVKRAADLITGGLRGAGVIEAIRRYLP